MENSNIQLRDIVSIVKKRKLSLIIPFFTILIIAAATSLFLPPIYISSSTILIEDQEIPTEYVQTTVTSYVEKRLQEIKQKIMSTTRLQEVIDKYGLYVDFKKRKTKEEIIEKMRGDINLDLISAEVINQRTGQSTSATIAFTLSYEGKNDPGKVQRVASVLASLFLEENIKVRERQVREASSFFEAEINKIEESLRVVEEKLSLFKEEHINELPELMQVNMQDVHESEINMERTLELLRSLKERKANLASQLASTSPQIAGQERLSILRLELSRLRTIYSEEYPDIIHVKHEIEEIEKKQLSNRSTNEADTVAGIPTNPAYISISSQLSSIQSEISSASKQLEKYENQSNVLRGYLKATPVVEKEYTKLLMERDSLKLKYDDLMQKYMEARVAQGLEKDQKGERFTLIDPALLPEKPYKPNRLVIFLIGIFLGVVCSAGLTAILELTDDTIRDGKTLSSIAPYPVLSVIPILYTEKEIMRQKGKRATIIAFGVITAVIVPVAFHYLVMDLYIVWAKLMRNIAL